MESRTVPVAVITGRQEPMKTHGAIKKRWTWKPIEGCPGRCVLEGGVSNLTISDLAGCDIPVARYDATTARDTVLVADLVDGGLISYAKPDGTYIHTLCDRGGFQRKLEQLGIRRSTEQDSRAFQQG